MSSDVGYCRKRFAGDGMMIVLAKNLFVHDTWQFVQIDVFDKPQAEQFVGPDRWKMCQRLEATELFVPRSLEAIRNISVDKLEGVRTASQIYWRSLLHTFEVDRITQNPDTFRSPDGSWEIRTHHALQLFALLGFECNRQGFLDGVQSGEPFRTFLRALWLRHQGYLEDEFNIRSKPALEAILTILARLNAAIDFAALDHDGISQVIFQNRTLQDLFAAIWMCTHASKVDVQWFSDNRFVRWQKESKTHYQMWKLAAEMPAESEGQMIARMDQAYVKAVRVLFEPSLPDKSVVRSTEMIWRSCSELEEIGKRKDTTGSDAREALEAFESEYPRLLKGAASKEAQRICEDFEAWLVDIDPTVAGWQAGDLDVDGAPLPIVTRQYRMAKYTVTNELYSLFDIHQQDRYDEQGKAWGVDFSKYARRRRAPVVAIDWYDTWCVAKWLGGQLPTESEWEYACRAGQRRRYSVGDRETLTPADARFGLAGAALAIEVDAFSKGNAWGLYQMHGNVWEWCEDWYDSRESSRCLRGGAFNRYPERCRSADRNGRNPSDSSLNIGVRISRAAGD